MISASKLLKDIVDEKMTVKFTIKTPYTIDVEKFCALKAKAYCFKLFEKSEIRNL